MRPRTADYEMKPMLGDETEEEIPRAGQFCVRFFGVSRGSARREPVCRVPVIFRLTVIYRLSSVRIMTWSVNAAPRLTTDTHRGHEKRLARTRANKATHSLVQPAARRCCRVCARYGLL